MARKKDLGGLAALAGLAYMASRDKATKGDVPVDDAKPTATGFMNEKEPGWDTKGSEYGTEKEPGWDTKPSTAAPARTSTRATKAKDMGDESYNPDVKQRLKDDQYNPAVKQRSTPTLNILEEAKEEARRRRAGSMAVDEASRPTMRAGDMPKRGQGLGAIKMKSGGSVKGWGIARGARKAKTY